MKSFTYLFGAVVLIVVINLPASAQNTSADSVSFRSLLEEMVNREALARYPHPYYTTRQFSSYDRNSTKPRLKSWFANWDRSQFIRVEKHSHHKEYVMMDTDGPGAIVRFWMTFAGKGAGQGTLRVYFDGEQKPTIKGKAVNILSGGALVGKPLSSSVSPKTKYKHRGHDLYLPLPYSKHCKVTYQSNNIEDRGAKSGGEAVYYNIGYRDYEPGTKVKTFSTAQIDENKQLLRRVQEKLLYRNKDYELKQLKIQSGSFERAIPAGDSIQYSIEGPAAIRRISMKLDAKDPNQALRSTILKISFDGQQTVWAPVGDFFGTGYQYRKSDTWYTTVTSCGLLRAYWIMPFQTKAKITIKNLGNQRVNLSEGQVAYSDWQWDTSSMHFGASWHQYSDLNTGGQKNMEAKGNPFDVNYTTLKGKGVYVGDALTLFNTSYAWWGEGDEKIYIDGEDFPSHFGTGSEDYYGYAWARPESFINHPFISQPDGSGDITPGYTINLRFRSLDAIPFQQKLKFDMGLWHWAGTTIDYAPTTFYYLKPGG
ncbi:MAG TPA: glycoside hydrolase family 172 protein, partial [Balneolaceae bacterium]|nr:glycoside hydrolase family 172 protein [Balneolaceae bacterium]